MGEWWFSIPFKRLPQYAKLNMKIDRDIIGMAFIVSCIVVLSIMLCIPKRNSRAVVEEPVADTTEQYSIEVEDEISDYKEGVVYDMAYAFARVESGCNPDAVNGNCVGYLQISPICVKEVNRILGDECFTLKDRYDMWASIAMFVVIMDHKNPGYDLRKACEIWNPRAGEWYYEKVKSAYENL